MSRRLFIHFAYFNFADKEIATVEKFTETQKYELKSNQKYNKMD